MVDTAASAIPGSMVFDFPARPYTNGTTDDTPKPTRRKPVIAVATYGKMTAVSSPTAMMSPLNWRIGFTLNLVTSQSAIKRPAAMLLINAT